MSNTHHPAITSTVKVDYPDFKELPSDVCEKFESLPTKVNFFRMLGHSPGAFIPMIDLTQAIFKNLTISDYHKELLVLLVAARENVAYEWEQHVSIAQTAGVRPEQFIAIAEERFGDSTLFKKEEQILLRFGMQLLNNGQCHGVLLNHALQYFSLQEISDAMIVIGYYRMLSGYIKTFNIPIDPQVDGNWIKS